MTKSDVKKSASHKKSSANGASEQLYQAQRKEAKPAPIFTDEMFDLILADRKTETRRVIKPQPKKRVIMSSGDGLWYDADGIKPGKKLKRQSLMPGLYYLREELRKGENVALYARDGKPVNVFGTSLLMPWQWKNAKLPKRAMPKAAARYFIRIRRVWDDRLQNITEVEAVLEGAKADEFDLRTESSPGRPFRATITARGNFKIIWNMINAKRERGRYAYDKNPWVFVYRFVRCV